MQLLTTTKNKHTSAVISPNLELFISRIYTKSLKKGNTLRKNNLSFFEGERFCVPYAKNRSYYREVILRYPMQNPSPNRGSDGYAIFSMLSKKFCVALHKISMGVNFQIVILSSPPASCTAGVH